MAPNSVPTSNQRDVAAYTHSYDLYGNRQIKDGFWGNPRIRRVVTKQRFEYHDANHRPSCFKKDCECRFLFPKLPHTKTVFDDKTKDSAFTLHRLVDGKKVDSKSWLIYPKRPIGSEYINQHSHAVSEVLNCNSNIQIGDPTHVFYSTLYTSKSTQEDDANRQKRVAMAIVRRLLRQERMILSGEMERIPSGFSEGISRLLCGLNAATSRDVVSAPMAHFLVCRHGKRFVYSHDFAPLLINQMDDTLAGRPVRGILRKSKEYSKKKKPLKDRKEVMWLDSLSNDYLFRPNRRDLNNVSLYEFTMNWEKSFQSHDGSDDDSFLSGHPGRLFTYCSRRDQMVIPRVSYVKNSLCMLADLDINNEHPSYGVQHIREVYAKTALLLFYPYRSQTDLMINGSFWTKFMVELQKKRRNMDTKFFDKGFEILQNIDDRLTMQKNGKRPKDEIDRVTTCEKHFETPGSKKRKRVNEDEFLDLSELGED